MMNVRVLFLAAFGCLMLSCGGNKGIATKRDKNERYEKPNRPSRPVTPTVKPSVPATESRPAPSVPGNWEREDKATNYVDIWSDTAMREMRDYGIPASITLAQGLLESALGKGRLAMEGNNHFGIKCHTDWEGERIYHDDDRAQECFRVYEDASFSYRDHSLFLANRKRYAQLFTLDMDDYKGWARGLKKAGYATDPKYPKKLISLIERYGLDRYDQAVLGADYRPLRRKPAPSSRVSTHRVTKGDTLYSLSRMYGVSVDQLRQWNKKTGSGLSIDEVLIVKDPSDN